MSTASPLKEKQKPAPASEVDNGEFKLLDISNIIESKTNPRKTFKQLEELADSIRSHGVVEPILVRPIGAIKKAYELIAGARRYRASKLAGKKNIPAIVRELDDKAAAEIQVIENDQRADVHPLEQAEGYEALIGNHGYDVASLAKKIGRPNAYVHHRLQINKLIEPGKKLFADGYIHFGHALLIARQQPADQEAIIGELKNGAKYGHECRSVKSLASMIERNFHFDLSSAPFKTDDAALVPSAGTCVDCSKRTGFNRDLFPDIKAKDICTDRACFNSKKQAVIQVQIKKLEENGEKPVQISTEWYRNNSTPKEAISRDSYREATAAEIKSLPARDIKTAVVVDGDGVGETMKIYVGKESGSNGRGNNEYYKRQEAARKKKNARHAEVRNAILSAVLEKVDSKPDVDAIRRMALYLIARMDFDSLQSLAKRRGWKKPEKTNNCGRWQNDAAVATVEAANPIELHRFVIEASLVGYTRITSFDSSAGSIPKPLMDAAKAFKVDARRIATQAAKQKEKKDRNKKAA